MIHPWKTPDLEIIYFEHHHHPHPQVKLHHLKPQTLNM